MMVLLITAIVSGVAIAQDFQLGAGGGAFIDMSLLGNGWKKDKDNKASSKATSFGGFVFFDATFAELDITFGITKPGKTKVVVGGDKDTIDAPDKTSFTFFGFGLLGKYPLDLGAFTLSPMLGIHYNIFLSAKYDGDKVSRSDIKDFDADPPDQFSLLFGAGINFPFTDNIALKADLLFRLGLPTKEAKDAVKDLDGTKATMGFGPQLRVGVIYTF